MVRAAVSGVINYAGADPKNRQWKIKHLLTLTELARREDYELTTAAHRHWLALVAHGSLTQESFGTAKTHATELLNDIQHILFPWNKSKDEAKEAPKVSAKPAIIPDKSAQELITRYKELHGGK
jgi:hypothetical protein